MSASFVKELEKEKKFLRSPDPKNGHIKVYARQLQKISKIHAVKT